MIVDNLNFAGAALGPHKTYAPLLVDSDTVLALSVTAKALQSISGNRLQVRERGRSSNHLQLSHRHLLKAPKARHSFAIKQCLRVL